jgi:hypothetical protein
MTVMLYTLPLHHPPVNNEGAVWAWKASLSASGLGGVEGLQPVNARFAGYRRFLCLNWPAKSVQKFPKSSCAGVRASTLVVRSQILTSPYNPSTRPCITAVSSEKFTKSLQKGAYARNVMFRDANGRLNRLIQGPCELWRSSLAASSNRTSRIFSIGNAFCGT